MKTLEERLREIAIPAYACEKDDRVVFLSLALLIVAGAQKDAIPMRDRVLMWLGYWRDHIPPKAVSALQDICGIPTNSPSEGNG